jgi:uncharacterized protein involved in exopolysaccharide biosynthesis
MEMRALRPFLRGLPVIALCLIAALMLAKNYLRYATPQFESTAKIKLADVNEGPTSTNLFKDFDLFSTTNKIGAEVEVMKSEMLVTQALDRLPFDISTYRVGQVQTTELYKECPFTVDLDLHDERWADQTFSLRITPAHLLELTLPGGKVVKGRLGEHFHLPQADLCIEINGALLAEKPGMRIADRYQFVWHSRDRLVADVINKLDITSVDKDIAILRISFQSPVAEKAADLVNTLAATYMDDYIANKYKVANTTVKFLNQQVASVGERLAYSEDSIERYRDQKNIINIRQETETDLRKVAELKIQLSNLRMSLAAVESLYNYMKSGQHNALELAPNFEAFNDLLSTEIIKKIKGLQAERQDLLLRFTPEDEKVLVIERKLTDLNEYLLEGVKNTRNNLRVKYGEIEREIHHSEQVFVGLPTREKDLTILERDFQLNQKLYNFLHEKQTEAEIAQAATITFHRVISAGEVPLKPMAPNRALITVVSGFLGLLTGLLLVYLYAALRARPTDAHSIQKESATPVAATLPYLKTTAEYASAFRQLMVRLELKDLLKPGTCVVLSAFTEREGLAFCFEQLAGALRRQGRTVRIVRIEDYQALPPAAAADELVLVCNQPLLNDSHALAVMAAADVNLVVIDGAATPLARIPALDLLALEYHLPGVHFCLNREGYTPGLLRAAQKLGQYLSANLLRRDARRAPAILG